MTTLPLFVFGAVALFALFVCVTLALLLRRLSVVDHNVGVVIEQAQEHHSPLQKLAPVVLSSVLPGILDSLFPKPKAPCNCTATIMRKLGEMHADMASLVPSGGPMPFAAPPATPEDAYIREVASQSSEHPVMKAAREEAEAKAKAKTP